MSYDEKTAERVRQVLANQHGLVERKMMGGLCFMVGGHMSCGVTGHALLIRVGPENYHRTLALAHVRPLEFAGRRPTGFILVDPAGHRTPAAFAKWIQRGLDFVSTLPRKNAARTGTRTVRGSKAK